MNDDPTWNARAIQKPNQMKSLLTKSLKKHFKSCGCRFTELHSKYGVYVTGKIPWDPCVIVPRLHKRLTAELRERGRNLLFVLARSLEISVIVGIPVNGSHATIQRFSDFRVVVNGWVFFILLNGLSVKWNFSTFISGHLDCENSPQSHIVWSSKRETANREFFGLMRGMKVISCREEPGGLPQSFFMIEIENFFRD
ncbi:hypothetical protein TNCV_5113121 [Trichonephila clavipes]|nr:hypothetical protein TNCV_5113121 [Trichonephila clavipes]